MALILGCCGVRPSGGSSYVNLWRCMTSWGWFLFAFRRITTSFCTPMLCTDKSHTRDVPIRHKSYACELRAVKSPTTPEVVYYLTQISYFNVLHDLTILHFLLYIFSLYLGIYKYIYKAINFINGNSFFTILWLEITFDFLMITVLHCNFP